LKNTGILWFRNDLRLHDNESLIEAMNKCKNVLPVFVFDERIFMGHTKFGFEKSAKFRTKFIIESVEDLRKNLKAKGSDLIIRVGKPEEEIFKLAEQLKSSWVFCNRERTDEEEKVQDKLEKKLWSIGQEIKYNRGKMLYYTADLPFPVSQVPDVFTTYRKEIESTISIRQPLPIPEIIDLPEIDIDRGEVPTLKTFGKTDIASKHIENAKFRGGETAVIKHLHDYIWNQQAIINYKESRNDLFGWDFSTKLSPWLSSGCISPKYIMEEVKKFEREVIKNDSTYWVYFELMWRDYFRLIGKKYGNKIFQINGPSQNKFKFTYDNEAFEAWKTGNTGYPFIDANMRQLNATGFMSNRGRQNVASFLVNDLKLNWLMGAEYFESLLIDYDPCSNYGNWNYIAGVGCDPREDRYFNTLSQAKRYDPQGEFVRYWIPAVKSLPTSMVHNPKVLNKDEQKQFKIKLGKDYPTAIVEI